MWFAATLQVLRSGKHTEHPSDGAAGLLSQRLRGPARPLAPPAYACAANPGRSRLWSARDVRERRDMALQVLAGEQRAGVRARMQGELKCFVVKSMSPAIQWQCHVDLGEIPTDMGHWIAWTEHKPWNGRCVRCGVRVRPVPEDAGEGKDGRKL